MLSFSLLFFSLSFSFPLALATSLCPEEDPEEVDQHGFFTHGLHVQWDAHHIGWAAAGVATGIATIASLTNIYLHCSNYNKPLEQRQIIRILLMPAIYSVVSFFSYRFVRHYVYFAVIRDIYEAIVLAAFLILCLLYVGRSPLEQQEIMARKEKSKLMFPLCCYRYRPSKPSFLIATKWSVMQYVLLRPMISGAAIITDSLGLFCGSSYRISFANVWLILITFLSATIALYGLLIIYHLSKEDLMGHRPMMKFMSIKIAVFLVFYQGFLLSMIDHLGYFRPTRYWSRVNISDGINALATTIEMAAIAIFQLFAFPYTEYKELIKGSAANRHTPFWINFLHSQDYRDFALDIKNGVIYFYNSLRGKAQKVVHKPGQPTNDLDFQAAFGYTGRLRQLRSPTQGALERSKHAGDDVDEEAQALSAAPSDHLTHKVNRISHDDLRWSPRGSIDGNPFEKSSYVNEKQQPYDTIQLNDIHRDSFAIEAEMRTVTSHRGTFVQGKPDEGQDKQVFDSHGLEK